MQIVSHISSCSHFIPGGPRVYGASSSSEVVVKLRGSATGSAVRECSEAIRWDRANHRRPGEGHAALGMNRLLKE